MRAVRAAVTLNCVSGLGGRSQALASELAPRSPTTVDRSEKVDRSLYERLGGLEAINAVARAFEERAGKDDRINQKFARTNLDRLTKEFVDQLCQDTGGPCTYTGRSMKETHLHMGVTSGEWDAFMEDLVATLDGFDVPKAEQDELLNLLRPMRAEIVEVESSQTGTPLPSAFTPGPPL
jgi:hemoglobin